MMDPRKRRMKPCGRTLLPLSLCVTALLVACSDNDDKKAGGPAVIALDSPGPVVSTRHEGEGDGLLGGFGLSGLLAPPALYADSQNPTAAELRRATLLSNYTALVDRSSDGGFGTLYGPRDDTLYPGREFKAYVGPGINRAAMMLQLPDSFDKNKPCLVVAPSSGSRNVYGAVATGGEWGLSKGCAVAYTDANKGTGAVELTLNTGFNLTLEAVDLSTTTDELSFVVPTTSSVPSPSADYAGVALPSKAQLDAYAAQNPHRYAFKHAHSQKNVEKDWGKHTLESIQFALDTLSTEFNTSFTPDNTLIIGASVSNGGSAILRAAEQSSGPVFDGIVVGEPNINPVQAATSFTIQMGDREQVSQHSRPLYEYALIAELYAGCAGKAPENAGAAFAKVRGDTTARCNALVDAGLLTAGDLASLGTQANQQLLDAGFLPESTKLLVGYSGIDLFQSLLATYGNAYTRSSVVDALCNISMAYVEPGTVQSSSNPAIATLAADSSGIPRTAGLYLMKDDSPAGAIVQIAAPSGNGALDYNMEGALCWRDLFENSDNPLNQRLLAGIGEIQGSGNLQGVPAILVHGRADALIPVNHSSRPYYALNQQVEGENSAMRYYEVPHAQHLDFLLSTYAAADMPFVPIDYYFKQSLELMYEHLTNNAPLPASQVVNSSAPEGGVVTLETLGEIAAQVPASRAITYSDAVLSIPE